VLATPFMNSPVSDAALTISWAIFFNITITPIVTGSVTILVPALGYTDISENIKVKKLCEHAKVIPLDVQ